MEELRMEKWRNIGCVCFGFKSLLEMLFRKCPLFGRTRKIGSNGKLFQLTVKYALWPYKSSSVFILPSNNFRNSQTRKERKKDSQMQRNSREREKKERVGRVSSGPTPEAAVRSSPNPKRSGEIAPLSSRHQVLNSRHQSLSFSISLSLLNRVWSSLICLIADHSLADMLSRQSAWSLWSLIFFFFFFFLWWCGWWRFGGFCVVWWWVLWYKICLEAEKMTEKVWKICRKIAFSEYYQTLKIVF